MSSVSPTLSEIFNAMQHDISDDHNVLSVRYKYGMTTTQRIRDIVKEIITGKHNGERFLCTNVRSVVCMSICVTASAAAAAAAALQ